MDSREPIQDTMQLFVGVKIVKAAPMNRLDYNQYRGWELPSDENGADEGYLVEYQNESGGNHPNHEGYISWCPTAQFEEANRRCDAMTFGHAIEAMKQGKKVARAGWNGKDMYIYHVPANTYATTTEAGKAEFGEKADCGAYISMKPASGPLVIGWLASQTDMLAEDWQIVK